MPCSMVKVYWCFRWTYCLYHQGQSVSEAKNQQAAGITFQMIQLFTATLWEPQIKHTYTFFFHSYFCIWLNGDEKDQPYNTNESLLANKYNKNMLSTPDIGNSCNIFKMGDKVACYHREHNVHDKQLSQFHNLRLCSSNHIIKLKIKFRN